MITDSGNAPLLTILSPAHIAIDGEVLPVVSTEVATQIWAIVLEDRARREQEAAA